MEEVEVFFEPKYKNLVWLATQGLVPLFLLLVRMRFQKGQLFCLVTPTGDCMNKLAEVFVYNRLPLVSFTVDP